MAYFEPLCDYHLHLNEELKAKTTTLLCVDHDLGSEIDEQKELDISHSEVLTNLKVIAICN